MRCVRLKHRSEKSSRASFAPPRSLGHMSRVRESLDNHSGPGLGADFDVEELIRTTTSSGRVAALIAEPIQGVGGFITTPPEYFPIVVDIVRKYGGVFICDEVQTGFGRTGEKWFGIEHWGVQPDIITCAKGMAYGTPMGATVATAEVADSFEGLTISTFGGNPVC